MAENLFDKLNAMHDEIDTDVDVEDLWEKGAESISKNNKLADLLYDTLVASTKEYLAETNKAGEEVSNSMANAIEKGVPVEYFDDMSLKPELSEVHQQLADDFDDKLHQARMQGLKDPVTVGATVAGGVTGSAWLLPMATAPFMINDLTKAAQQGQGGKATANMALPILASGATNMLGSWGKLANYAPRVANVLTNPLTGALVGTGAAMTDANTRQWASEHPGRAAFLFGGVDAIRGFKAGMKKLAEPSAPKIEGEATAPIDNTMPTEGDAVLANKVEGATEPKVKTEEPKTTTKDQYGFEEKEGMVKPNIATEETTTSTKPSKPKTLNEEAFPENSRENIKANEEIVNNIVEDVQDYRRTPEVMQGAYGEELTFSPDNVYEGQVSVDGIWKVAQRIAPALPFKRLRRQAEDVLGFYRPNSEDIHVRGFRSWSVLCHEIGHHLSRKTGFGRGNTAIEQELLNGMLSIWSHNEYGDHNTPRGYRIHVEEGRAAFMNEFLINPAKAQRDFPLTYADFTSRLAQDPMLQANMELLGQQVRKWGSENHWGQVNSSMAYEGRPPIGRQISDAWLKFETAAVDELAPLQKVVRDFLLDHPDSATDNNGNVTTRPKTITFEENPANIAQRAKEAINSITSCLMGESGIDTPTIIQAVANKYGVALNPVTMLDVFAPIRDLNRRLPNIREVLHTDNVRDWYEGATSYILAKHELEVIRVKNQERMARLQEQLANTTDLVERQEIRRQMRDIALGLDDYLTTDARQTLERVVADGDRIPELVEFASRMRDFNENILRIAVAGDMLKPEEARRFMSTYRDYVPMQRSFAINGNNAMGAVANDKAYANISKIFRGLSEEGSDRSVKDPMAQYALNMAALVSKIERNKVAKAVKALSDRDGGGWLFENADNGGNPYGAERIVTIWDHGVQSSYRCKAEGLYEALMYANSATQQMQMNVIETVLQGAATTLRKGATSTPAFALANMIKDLFNATMLNRDGRKFHTTIGGRDVPIPLPGVDQALLLWDGVMARLDRQLYAEYKAEGVQYTTSIGQSRQIHSRVNDYINRPQSNWTSIEGVWEKIKAGADNVMSITDVGEQLPRLGLYKRARQRGATPFEAASIASDGTVNFMRSGSKVKTINRYVPFFNAVVQGDSKILRALHEDPVGVALTGFTYCTLPALYCWSQNHDKDWYRNMPLSKKNKAYYLDLSSAQDGSMVIAIPKNESLGYLFGSVVERMLDFAVDNDKNGGSVVSDAIKDTVKQTVPSGFPPGFLWLIEGTANYSFFREKPIVDQRLGKVKPEDQYNLYTSEVAKFAGKQLGMSPMKIDNAIYDLTGTMGYLVNGGMDYAIRSMSGDIQRPARKWTEMTRFTYQDGTSSSRSADVFYAGIDRLEAEYGSAVKNKGNAPKPKPSEELSGMRKALARAKDISTDIKGLDMTDLDAETKRAERDKLVKERDEVFRFANKKYLGYKYIQSPESMPREKPPKKKKTTRPSRKRKTTKK